MAAEAAYLRPAEFSADRRDPDRTCAVAAAAKRQSVRRRQQRDPADAEGLDRDEPATHQRADRHQRHQRHEHYRRDSEGRAQSLEFGGAGPAWGKAIPADIAKSLEGNWREELLFVLRQEVEIYRVYQEKIAACDQQLRQHLESFGSKVDLEAQPIGPRPKGKRESNNAPAFDLRTELYRITGIDWSQINGMDVLTAQTVIAEAITAMARKLACLF